MALARLPTASELAAGLASGLLATTVMTCTTSLESRVVGHAHRPVTYDASDHVVTAVAAVLRHEPTTEAQRRVYFALAHWAYGSAVALAYPAVRRGTSSDAHAAAWFLVGCQTMAMTLFPTLGGAPAPWTWTRSRLVSSVGQHTVYAAVVAWSRRSISRLGRC